MPYIFLMKILELHALFDGKKREVPAPENLRKYFEIWKEISADYGVTDFDYNSFVAGWVISGNSSLKEKVLNLIRKKKEIRGVYWNDHTKYP